MYAFIAVQYVNDRYYQWADEDNGWTLSCADDVLLWCQADQEHLANELMDKLNHIASW